MKKIIIAIVFVSLCFSYVISAIAFEDGDVQLWNANSIKWKFADKWKAQLEEELKFGNDVSELYYAHTDLGIAYKLVDWLSLGLSYRHIYEKKDSKWLLENRPHINIAFKYKWEGFTFKDRIRIELRIRDNKDRVIRYRNKLTVKFPFKWTDQKIRPYIADEIFASSDTGEFDKNRFYVGLTFNIFKNFKGDIYYLWEAGRSGSKWTDYNVLGIKLKAAF